MRDSAMKKTVIFDLDGTLVDSCHICVSILEDMIEDRGVDGVIDPVLARSFMSHGGQTMVAGLLGDACGDIAADLREFRERYAETQTPHSALFNGVASGLRELHDEGHTLAICSNKPQLLCENALSDTGLLPLFTAIVGSREGMKPKPSTDLLELTLRLLGQSAQDCIYVGDSELDAQVAEQLSMGFRFMTYGYASTGWQPNNAQIHDHFADLTRSIIERREAVAA